MADRSAGPAAHVELRDLHVHFGRVRAVDGLDLDLPSGALTALLGPSGCGKSTTLSVLAGLQTPSAGTVLLDGQPLLGVPPERRPVTLVFQKPLLFPHLTVAQNVGFGLRMQRMPRAAVAGEVEHMLERVRLGGLGHRRPHELSGGQEQRVSLARALVRRPRLLLLDEPFSQLDPELRAEMRQLVRELHDALGLTTLFVTHDRDEAVDVADRIALMLDGSLAGSGTPEQIYTRPPSLATARFFGATNEIRGAVTGGRFRSADGSLEVPTDEPDGDSVLVVRPEAVSLGGPGPDLAVKDVRFAGTHLVVDLALPDGQPLRSHAPLGTTVVGGGRVSVQLPADRCTVFGWSG